MRISICLTRLIIHPADINVLIMDTSKFYANKETCNCLMLKIDIYTYLSYMQSTRKSGNRGKEEKYQNGMPRIAYNVFIHVYL